MKVTIVEGSPDEIRQAFPGLADAGAMLVPTTPAGEEGPETETAEAGEKAFVSEAVARSFLRRRPLSSEQRKILKILYRAYPARVLGTALQEKLGYRRPQFTGLMGAFGNRLSNTPGYIGYTSFFDQEWDYEHHSFAYTLPASARAALEAEKLV